MAHQPQGLSLPPIKVEPIIIPSKVREARTVPKTPTRIPFLSKNPKESTSSEDEAKSKSTTTYARAPKKVIQPTAMRRQKSASNVTSKPVLQSSRSNKTVEEWTPRQRTQSTTGLVTSTSSTKRKVSTLQERLQGLVDESKAWTNNERKRVDSQASEVSVKTVVNHDKVKSNMRIAMSPEGKELFFFTFYLFYSSVFISCPKVISL